MFAIWLENQTLSIRENLPIPTPKQGDALIHMLLAGICNTDLELCRGYYPYQGVLGHEFVGQVVEAPGFQEWVGKRVVGDINIACGQCENCQTGRPHHCDRRSTLGIANYDGCFSEFFVLPVKNLYTVPREVPDEMAVFSEPLAAALEIQEQVSIHPDERVLVIGAGRLGLLVAQILALTGCELKVLARRPRSQMILTNYNIPFITENEIQPHKADIVVEATGTPAGFELARLAVRPAGTIVVKSTYKDKVQMDLSSIVVDEIKLVGSRCGPHAAALRLMEKGIIDPRPLIESYFPLGDGLSAFKLASQPGILKVLLKPGQG